MRTKPPSNWGPIRLGLRTTSRRARAEVTQAELVVAWLLQGADNGWLKRLGDPEGTCRVVDITTVRINQYRGLVATVTGYVDGVEDPGLRCTSLPLSDLVIVPT